MTLKEYLAAISKGDNSNYSLKQKIEKLAQVMHEGAVSAKFKVSSISSLSSEQCEELKCGDVVCKEDSTGLHAYIVSYKKDGVGICLTYTDASCIETVSYDYVTDAWVYNSMDLMPLIDIENAESGTIQDVLGLDSNGKLVKGAISGGTKLYKHVIHLKRNTDNYKFVVLSNSSAQFTASFSTPSKISNGAPILAHFPCNGYKTMLIANNETDFGTTILMLSTTGITEISLNSFESDTVTEL